MTPEDLEAVRRVVAEELDAALVRHLAAREPKAKKSRAGLLTLKEAAELVRHEVSTIRNWIWQGKLKAYKPGRHPLVKEAELLALVDANESTAKRAGRLRRS